MTARAVSAAADVSGISERGTRRVAVRHEGRTTELTGDFKCVFYPSARAGGAASDCQSIGILLGGGAGHDADVCLEARKLGLSAVALDAPCLHNSRSVG